jgi:Ca2+-binding RTX toxin-like protein
MCDMIEALELRKLLTSTLNGAGVLTITGTTDNDVVTMPVSTILEIRPNGDLVPTLHIKVMMNGVLDGDFRVGLIKKVRVKLLDGNDYFSSGSSKGRKFKVFADGGAGNDTIFGGSRQDFLDGGLGDDYLNGGAKNDELASYAGSDTLVGGIGEDIADYSERTVGLHLTVDDIANDGAPGETGMLSTDIETIAGGAGADFISVQLINRGTFIDGLNGRNTLLGGFGDDTLFGGANPDLIRGFGGNDYLDGGKGRDKLYGDAGADIIVSGGDNIRDTIYGVGGEDFVDDDFMDILHNASISGFVYNDLNGDGVAENGEPGLDGRIVYLDTNNNNSLDSGEKSTVTAGGGYSFGGLAAGTYVIRQILPSGWSQTEPVGGAGITVTLTNGQSLSVEDFGSMM